MRRLCSSIAAVGPRIGWCRFMRSLLRAWLLAGAFVLADEFAVRQPFATSHWLILLHVPALNFPRLWLSWLSRSHPRGSQLSRAERKHVSSAMPKFEATGLQPSRKANSGSNAATAALVCMHVKTTICKCTVRDVDLRPLTRANKRATILPKPPPQQMFSPGLEKLGLQF